MDEPTVDDLSPYAKYVPEGCMPIFGIMVFGYLNGDGDVCGGWHYDGEVELGTLFGHMEIAKLRLAMNTYRDADEEDD